MSESLPPPDEPLESHGGIVPRLPGEITGSHRPSWFTWDLSTPGGINRLSKCKRPSDLKSDDVIDEVFLVRHVFCQLVDLPDDKTGELIRAVRTVLVLDDERTVAFVAKGVVDSLEDLTTAYGPFPWDAPKRVRAYRVRTRRARQTILLEAVETPPEE